MNVRKTGELVPEFEVRFLSGKLWDSRARPAGCLTLLTVYRGMWCPNCKRQLQALERLHDEFSKRGIVSVAISADTEERARVMAADYGLQRLNIGYEVLIASAPALGLFISKSEKEIEMLLFCEPGTFLIDEHARNCAAWITSNAFARTNLEDILAYTDFLREHRDLAPRGSA